MRLNIIQKKRKKKKEQRLAAASLLSRSRHNSDGATAENK
jgi:hypothetical protein